MTASYPLFVEQARYGMDENERITLRLEKENLELIDGFLDENRNYTNRSQLVRDAVQSFIRSVRAGGHAVTVRIPRHFLDREHAIVRAIEGWFSADRVKEIQGHRQEMDKTTGKAVAVSTGEKEGVIPR